MITASFRDSSPFIKFLFTLFAILVGFTVFMFLGMLFSIIFFNAGTESLSGKIDPLNPDNIPVLKFLQVFFSIGLFVSPPLVVAVFFHGKVGEYLKINKIPSIYVILLSILIVFVSMPLINFLVMFNENIHFPESLEGIETIFKKMENEAKLTSQSFLATSSIGAFLVNLFVIALIPAVGEEFLFRGVFQRLFHEWSKNIHMAIFLSAFIFSAVHFQFYGIIPRFVLGAFFGYMFYWSKNLWVPIIAHFFNNSFAVTLYFIKGNVAQKAENIGKGTDILPTVAFSILSVIVLLYILYRIGKENTNNQLSNFKTE